jgi:hypothetical protein
VVFRISYRFPPDTKRVYTGVNFFFPKKLVLVRTLVLKKSTNHQFFHENCQFFQISETPGTSISLISKIFLETRTGGSSILLKQKDQKFSDADSENFKESEPPVISIIEISNDTEIFFKKGYSQNQTQPEALRYPFRFITPVQTTNQN